MRLVPRVITDVRICDLDHSTKARAREKPEVIPLFCVGLSLVFFLSALLFPIVSVSLSGARHTLVTHAFVGPLSEPIFNLARSLL